MEESIVVEAISIFLILAIGFGLVTTVTPILNNLDIPEASPLVDIVYSYAEYGIREGQYVWRGYLYVYDREPVLLERVNILTPYDVEVTRIYIVEEGEDVYSYSSTSIGLRLTKGLYEVVVVFKSGRPIDRLTYILVFGAGHAIDGETPVLRGRWGG